MRKQLWNSVKDNREADAKYFYVMTKIKLTRHTREMCQHSKEFGYQQRVLTQQSNDELLLRKLLAEIAAASLLEALLTICWSLKNKIDEFAKLVATTEPSIVIGTASWLSLTSRFSPIAMLCIAEMGIRMVAAF